MMSRTTSFATTLTLALATCTLLPAQQSHLPAGHPPHDAALDQAIHQALPAGATQIDRTLPVDLGPLGSLQAGRVQVVLYRRSTDDPTFHAIAVIPAAHGAYRTLPLPDPQLAPSASEEVTTAVFAADIGFPDPGASVPGGATQGLAQTLPPAANPSANQTPPAAEPTQPARAARPEASQRALVILFYTHQPGQTESQAFGRVYVFESGHFRIDDLRSQLLDGVRTAAVARLRLAPAP